MTWHERCRIKQENDNTYIEFESDTWVCGDGDYAELEVLLEQSGGGDIAIRCISGAGFSALRFVSHDLPRSRTFNLQWDGIV